ncbi:MAG TPA: DUF885 family protein [Acidimicrobiales bacterium]|nr:DUF885 family protein [Acidimicrobiales bacterium]
MVSRRLKAVWDLNIPEIREYAGVHEYDGAVMDLSPGGVRGALDQLGPIGAEENLSDPHDESHLQAFEQGLLTSLEVAEMHRWNPLPHLFNLDLSCYDREYAPTADRQAARRAHLARWPEAVDASLESLDAVPAPVAEALAGPVAGLADGVDPEERAALAAHARLLERVQHAADHGNPDASLGAVTLARLLGDGEAMPVDLGRLELRADAERDRLRSRLEEECERIDPDTAPPVLIRELVRDHPPTGGIYSAARRIITEATAFTVEHDLLPKLGGECRVGPAPPSRRYAVAMMSWNGAYEADAPAWYYVNPPEESWDEAVKDEWLSMFSATTLPAITVHEVTPGHFAHGRMLRDFAEGDVRRSLCSQAFVEGWAHYGEELMVEAGFRADDARFALGVWIEALLRVTRLAAALGVHRGTMSVDEATRRFESDAYLLGPAARTEATRATFEPTYGRYTWGKLEIMRLRDEAIATWGNKFTLRRFHETLLSLGGPPLGTMGDILAP